MTEQLVDYLESNQLLHPEQFGFRRKHSTETATSFFVESLKCSIDRGYVMGAVFLDLKKAFDTVSHNILLYKLSKFNFSKQTSSWFASYLQSREQCVKINLEKSALQQNNMGIPQGSILGLLLFSLYINDLPESCVGAGCQLYADDTVIYASTKTPTEASEILSSYMNRICHWLHQNRLTLNMKKTVSMCFSIKKTSQSENLRVAMQGEEIEKVNEFKFLGVVLDSKLKFGKHVKKISKTIKSNLDCFKLIRHQISYKAAQLYMHGMIFSHMSYCVTVWSQTCVTVIKPISSLYNQALKIMDKKPMRWHHCHILKQYNMLSFDDCLKFSTVKMVFKCLQNLAPDVLCKLVSRQSSGRITRGTTSGNCKVERRKTSFGQSTFSIKGSQMWNTLPTEIKTIQDIKVFTKNVKDWLKQNQKRMHF